MRKHCIVNILIFEFTFLLCEQMDWGDNDYLVAESDTIQGRENIQLIVAMVGDSINMECQVAFTSTPVSQVRWRIDGKLETKDDVPIQVTKNGEVFIEDHLRLDNITAEMDGSTVSCEYSKGQYGGSVEAIFRVFQLEIELTDKNCNSLDKDIKLVFRENNRSSPAEETVDEKIKARISEITNLKPNQITADKSGYWVMLSIHTVQASEAILDMKPELDKVQEILNIKTKVCALASNPTSAFSPLDREENVFCGRGELTGYNQ